MSEEKFTDLFQTDEPASPNLKPGDRVKAMIAAIDGESIFLDIGVKSEGVLNAGELRNEEGELSVKAGDSIDVFLLSFRGGEMTFTTKIGSGHASAQELEDAFHSGIPVEGKVTGEIKGGFSVNVAGLRGFCPYSQMNIRRIEDPELYIDEKFSFKIIEFGSRGKNIILSARAILEEQRELEKEKLKETLEENTQIPGVVTSIQTFGAFVDIGGVDGLIPVSELAWGQTDKVEDVLQIGQQVEVIVKSLDWDRNRISLSLRETTPNPWDNIAEKFPLGSTQQGLISRLAAFGAFVTLEPGVDGLLHISKLGSGRRINHPREAVEEGQELTVRIDAIDEVQKRISLVPDDYVKQEKENQQEEKEALRSLKTAPQSMGTFADLLKAQLSKK